MSALPLLRPIPETKNSVILHEEACEVRAGEVSTRTHCRVVFDVMDFPSASVEIPDIDVDAYLGKSVSIQFIESGYELHEGRLSGISSGKRPSGYPFSYHGKFTEPIAVTKPRRVKLVEALIYNLERFGLNGLPTRGPIALGLRVGRYGITIGPISRDYVDLLSTLATPWHRPTYLLAIAIDGEGELAADVETLLFDIRQFLSFAWGRYIGIALARGTDECGAVAFEHWGLIAPDPIVPSYQQAHWFLLGHAEMLQELLPGYMRQSKDPLWKDVVEWALYWWLSANHAGQRSETSILASLAGLEVITSAPQNARSITPVALPGATRIGRCGPSGAASKIRGLLSRMNMPTSVVGQLDKLRAVAAQSNWDGPEAVVEIRNTLAHPARKLREDAAFQASQLAMWYLEMALLYLFDFKGECSNRTVFDLRGPEQVPWAQ